MAVLLFQKVFLKECLRGIIRLPDREQEGDNYRTPPCCRARIIDIFQVIFM